MTLKTWRRDRHLRSLLDVRLCLCPDSWGNGKDVAIMTWNNTWHCQGRWQDLGNKTWPGPLWLDHLRLPTVRHGTHPPGCSRIHQRSWGSRSRHRCQSQQGGFHTCAGSEASSAGRLFLYLPKIWKTLRKVDVAQFWSFFDLIDGVSKSWTLTWQMHTQLSSHRVGNICAFKQPFDNVIKSNAVVTVRPYQVFPV